MTNISTYIFVIFVYIYGFDKKSPELTKSKTTLVVRYAIVASLREKMLPVTLWH